ncbi:DNA cytosine methyltransferase [Methylocystis sp. JAN1]|uniref:DNA cytosine methyltransferase n=1 Tax=Methylocystis sp. JAN1 TaxID=3397211 RepID=UPI003FA26606
MTTFVDLFAGAGGLSLGLQNAGWKPLLASDIWEDAAATYRQNFPQELFHAGDISLLTGKRLASLVKTSPDWVVGGPPCQGFSTVGRRERSDPRNMLVREFARVVNELRPRNFLMENVLGLKDMKFVDFVSSLFPDYSVSAVILTAADFGVPQLRRRIFFVGDLKGRQFVPPKPTHAPDEYVTVWDAIGDLPALQPGERVEKYTSKPSTAYQRKLRGACRRLTSHEASDHPAYLVEAISYIPDGGNRQSIPHHLQPASGYHNSYSRLHSLSPAVAVTQNMGKPSGTRCIHPFQHRGLTAREGARLQGFPDKFLFAGGVTSQRLQIANAVSPILAEVLGGVLTQPCQWINESSSENHMASIESDKRPLLHRKPVCV